MAETPGLTAEDFHRSPRSLDLSKLDVDTVAALALGNADAMAELRRRVAAKMQQPNSRGESA